MYLHARAPLLIDEQQVPTSRRGHNGLHFTSLLGLFAFFGRRIVRLTALDIATFLDQMTHFVWRNRQLALRANIQCGSDQKVVAPPHPLR
jgi:hypothetical protein